MKTRILDTNNPRHVKQFRLLPFSIYRKNPYWVPPLPGEIEFAMDRKKHPFYAHSDADFIVVESEKQIVGRIAVMKNANYCDYHKTNTAFFYYFESIDDQQVAEALLFAAEDWCFKRKISELYGPRGLLRSNCIGLLVDGFDQHPATGMIYNMPYYQIQLETAGYQNFSDHFSGYLDSHIDQRIHNVAKKVLSRGNFVVRSFHSTSEMQNWIPRMDEIHHRAFADNLGFCPSTPEEFNLLAKNILAIADPRYMKLILRGDDIAGFLIAFPNINQGIKFSRGNLFPFGWMALLLAKKYTRILDIEAVGLLPEYQGLGGNAVLYAEIDKVLHNSHFKKAEIVQVDERNYRSRSDADTMKVVWNKRHRTFKKSLS
ncbi:MAG: hypothetical protein FD147_63 [Chloroflexi bacterium]|nr:MAG: hypothetical protein FD147_63 [Chloroflexota bacterium]MBA4374690.1 hypothetical protein [Anaerolinea sp.]